MILSFSRNTASSLPQPVTSDQRNNDIQGDEEDSDSDDLFPSNVTKEVHFGEHISNDSKCSFNPDGTSDIERPQVTPRTSWIPQNVPENPSISNFKLLLAWVHWVGWPILTCVIGFVAVICCTIWARSEVSNGWAMFSQPTQIHLSTKEKMSHIIGRFPQQNDHTWSYLNYTFHRAQTNPDEITVYLMIGSDARTSRCFAHEVARIVSVGQIPLFIDGSDCSNSFLTLKEEFAKKKIMVVSDLQELPAETAKDLHYFCDLENPIVAGAFVLLTLKVEDEGPVAAKRRAINKLNSLWSSELPSKVIDPLISRLTNTVLEIYPEEHSQIPCS